MKTGDAVLIIGGLAVLGIGYIIYSGISDVVNLPSELGGAIKALKQNIETGQLQGGANAVSNSNNYSNAKVIYANSTSQYDTANLTGYGAPASIIVSPNNQNEGTFGGQPLSYAQLYSGAQGTSVTNAFNYANGWQGVGYYYVVNSAGRTITQELANQYDYNNSYLANQ
jgi:hypothetical protein